MSRYKLAIILLLLSAVPAFSQYLNSTGTPTFTTSLPVENGFINVANGNLHIEIPIASYPQRGKLGLTSRLMYDSRIWVPVDNGSYVKWQPYGAGGGGWYTNGWRYSDEGPTWSGAGSFNSQVQVCGELYDDEGDFIGFQYYDTYEDFRYYGPDGTERDFNIATYSGCDDPFSGGLPDSNSYAIDGSGYYMVVTGYNNAVVYAPDGTQVYPYAQDTSGNYYSADSNGNTIDSLQRTPVQRSVINSSTTDWNYLTTGGTRYTVEVVTTGVSVSTAFSQSGVLEHGSDTLTLIDHITFPDGSKYSFGYNGYGELNSITLPTGSTVNYTYSNYSDPYGMVNQWVSQRSSGGGTWTLAPSVYGTCTTTSGCQQTVQLTTPASENVMYTFTLNGGAWDSEIDAYSGSISTGNKIYSTVVTNDFGTACVTTGCVGAQFVSGYNSVTTLANGQQRQANYTFDSPNTHNIIYAKEWDYTSGSFSGIPTRETDTTYVTSSTYTNKHMVNLPVTVSVKDAGTVTADTQYSYDGSSVTSTSGSGITQHDYTNYPYTMATRGLITNTRRCTSSLTSVPCTGVNNSATYNDLGNMVSSATNGGNTTGYSYSGTYDGAYLTGVSLPSTGASHSTSATYDSYTGLLASSTDDAGQSISYSYDYMLRPHEVTFPDGGDTVLDYYPIATSGTSSAIRKKQKLSSSPTWMTSFTYLDGYGRPVRSSSYNNESGSNVWDNIDTCYDTSSRVSFVSLPYQAATGSFPSGVSSPAPPGSPASSCSGLSGDTYAYSYPTGQKSEVTITHADSSSSVTDTYARATMHTDEGNGTATTSKIWQVDAFGRTTSTCEITSVNQQPGSGSYYAPAYCALDLGATTNGFLTTSAYDARNNLMGITQGALSRSFTYDPLSRLTQTIYPESGETDYTYDSDGNLYTRVRPAVNQRGSSTVTTTYSYDALDRLTQVAYSDSTPTVHHYYDETTYSSNSLNYSNGRLTRSVTASGSSVNAFSYDKMGRIVDNWQVTPFSSTAKDLSYQYDLAGNMTSSSDGFSHTLTHTYNQASRLTQVTSSLTGGNYPSPLISSVTYGAFGPSSSSLGNTKSESFSYNSVGRNTSFSVSGSVYSLSRTFAPNGLLTYANDSVNGTTTFAYDDFNRVASASDSGNYAVTFDYDRYGNRWNQSQSSGSPTTTHKTFNDAYNQVDTYCYDYAGNLLKEASCPSPISTVPYLYDAENRMISYDNGSHTYVYDAEGRRIAKQSGGTSAEEYLYDLADRRVATRTGASTWSLSEVFSGGRHLATYTPSTTYFNHSDFVGTTRVRSGPTGSPVASCTSEPFGNGQNCGTDAIPDHFGALDDDDSGLDHATNRQYSPSLARWFSPDPYDGNLSAHDPQSLNRYAYVENDPADQMDPTGLDGCGFGNEDCHHFPWQSIFGIFINIGFGQGQPSITVPPPIRTSPTIQRSSLMHFPNETNGLPDGIRFQQLTLCQAAGVCPNGTPCDFGPCGSGLIGTTGVPNVALPSVIKNLEELLGLLSILPKGNTATIGPDNGKSKPNVPPIWEFCSTYRDGTGAGDALYDLCMTFPDGPWSNCVRGKLLRQFTPHDNPIDLIFRYGVYDHGKDFITCKTQ